MMLLAFVIFSILGFSRAADDILAVSVIFRHGDRTPLKFAPNDPYKDPSFWPVAPGELTNVGKRQHYELGKWFRSRYDGFLSPLYNHSDIYVRSSDDNRCLMSAESNLAGLYIPQGGDVWEAGLPWQPIPVHTIPKDQDDIIEVQDACLMYASLLNEAEKLPRFKSVLENNKKLLDYLSAKSGADLSTLFNIWDFYDTLMIENAYNLSIPSDFLEAFPTLEKITDAAIRLYTGTDDLTTTIMGRFFDEVRTQFSDILEETGKSPKFKMYSAHDTQIFSVLSALKIQDLGMPPYASAVIFELVKPQEGGPFVRIFYKRNDSVGLVKLPDCDAQCKIDSFNTILEPLSLTKEEYIEKCSVSD